ncbi:MAG: type II secretion system protein, partial [Candidatus Ferrigenium altingense]
ACFIEFLPTKGGGRYRAGMGGDELDFSVADNSFEVLGQMPTGLVVGTDQIVVYNLGIAGADTYAGDNRATVSAPPAGAVANITSKLFPFDSPGHRFHVISAPVAYACDGAGTLWRYWGYAIKPLQADTDTIAELDALIAVQGARARLATHVSSCRFSYDAFVVAQRSGLVTTNLGITEEGETVTLYSAVHVSNQP